VTAVLRLVRDSDGGDALPPLEAWEFYMRGAGLSERYVHDSLPRSVKAAQRSSRSCCNSPSYLAVNQCWWPCNA
jgi:hypothetical protein